MNIDLEGLCEYRLRGTVCRDLEGLCEETLKGTDLKLVHNKT